MKPLNYNGNSTEVILSRCEHVDWPVLLKNTSKYFTSYTKLYFLLGLYDLEKWLPIINVTNLPLLDPKLLNKHQPFNACPIALLHLYISINTVDREIFGVKKVL